MKLLTALLLAGSTQAYAAGPDVVLTSDTSKLVVEMTDLPSGKGVLVAWDHLPGATPAGAMVYVANEGISETDYFAAGGGGLLAIVDHGGGRRWGFSVVAADPRHPERMMVDQREVDAAAVMAKYAAFENIATPAETQPVIDAEITAQALKTDQACGGHVVPQVRWADFTKPGKLALAKQAVSVLESVAAICADKDYRAVAKTVTTLAVRFQADGGALQLAHTATTLSVVFSETSYNPRESAKIWLTGQL